MKFKRNTQAIVRLAAEKSNRARRRAIEAINELQRDGAAINFNTVCLAARVSKTFLYDPKQSDLAEQIRSLRQLNQHSATLIAMRADKSDSAKDIQINRFKERIRTLEHQVQTLREENELLYGKLVTQSKVN
jgi:flavodoxin